MIFKCFVLNDLIFLALVQASGFSFNHACILYTGRSIQKSYLYPLYREIHTKIMPVSSIQGDPYKNHACILYTGRSIQKSCLYPLYRVIHTKIMPVSSIQGDPYKNHVFTGGWSPQNYKIQLYIKRCFLYFQWRNFKG